MSLSKALFLRPDTLRDDLARRGTFFDHEGKEIFFLDHEGLPTEDNALMPDLMAQAIGMRPPGSLLVLVNLTGCQPTMAAFHGWKKLAKDNPNAAQRIAIYGTSRGVAWLLTSFCAAVGTFDKNFEDTIAFTADRKKALEWLVKAD